MNITEITVSYGLTQSLPEYSNVKPSVTLKATVAAGEDEDQVVRALTEQARGYVEAIVDEALEQADRPAVWDNVSPRFRVWETRSTNDYDAKRGATVYPPVVALVPAAAGVDKKVWYDVSYNRMMRYEHARRIAQDRAAQRESALVLDCSDGDLARVLAVAPLARNDTPLRDEEYADDDER